MQPTWLALAALHVSVALFGFAGLFGKWLAMGALAIVLGRTLVAAVSLLAVVAMRRTHASPDLGLALNGIVLAIHWTTFFAAIQRTSVAIGLLGYATFPLFVLLLERLMLDRRWTRREVSTATLVTLGLGVLVPSFDIGDATLQGLALGVVSGFTFALLAVRSRRYAATHAPALVALYQNAFAACALFPLVLVADVMQVPSRDDIALIIVLGVVCTALAHTLFIASLTRLSAHTASVVAALEPVYGIVLAAFLLGEQPTLRTLIGAALIVGAALVATRSARVAV
ncbi:MAG TPA: EamA family transporter [Casimicrobiaceae bacterium]|nr:EamA family transporter [Casimicrobiaceae bacterium]